MYQGATSHFPTLTLKCDLKHVKIVSRPSQKKVKKFFPDHLKGLEIISPT